MTKKEINRIPCLDGIRAISILLVVFSHLFDSFGIKNNAIGNLGVRIFFVISGFLITSILVREFEITSDINLKKFYFRRTLRIFPAYYFYIFVILTLTVLDFYEIPIYTFITPLTYTSNYITVVWELGHSWSLSVEEQFYLLFPSMLLIFGLTRAKKLLLFLLLVAPVIRLSNLYSLQVEGSSSIPDWFIFGFHTNIDALAVGCLLALYSKTLHESKFFGKFLKSRIGVLLLLGLIFLVTFNSANIYFFYSFGLTIINISIGLCISWLIENHQNTVGKILQSTPFIFVGTLSYSIYLWQQPFTKYSEDKLWTHFPLSNED